MKDTVRGYNICWIRVLEGKKGVEVILEKNSVWVELSFDPVILLLGLYPKNPEIPIQTNLCAPMFIAAQFIIAKYRKQPKCPSVNECIKNCDTFTQWNSTQQKERRAPTLWDSMDGTGEHYAKWNKLGSERQIP